MVVAQCVLVVSNTQLIDSNLLFNEINCYFYSKIVSLITSDAIPIFGNCVKITVENIKIKKKCYYSFTRYIIIITLLFQNLFRSKYKHRKQPHFQIVRNMSTHPRSTTSEQTKVTNKNSHFHFLT